MTQKRKYPKKKLGIKNPDRPNGKSWKKHPGPSQPKKKESR